VPEIQVANAVSSPRFVLLKPLVAPGQAKSIVCPVASVTIPSAPSGRLNPFPSLLPPGIRSSGCGSGRSLFIAILHPEIAQTLRCLHVSGAVGHHQAKLEQSLGILKVRTLWNSVLFTLLITLKVINMLTY